METDTAFSAQFPNLHWPDTMYTFIEEEEQILVTQIAFRLLLLPEEPWCRIRFRTRTIDPKGAALLF